jgi:hypothetical protein
MSANYCVHNTRIGYNAAINMTRRLSHSSHSLTQGTATSPPIQVGEFYPTDHGQAEVLTVWRWAGKKKVPASRNRELWMMRLRLPNGTVVVRKYEGSTHA